MVTLLPVGSRSQFAFLEHLIKCNTVSCQSVNYNYDFSASAECPAESTRTLKRSRRSPSWVGPRTGPAQLTVVGKFARMTLIKKGPYACQGRRRRRPSSGVRLIIKYSKIHAVEWHEKSNNMYKHIISTHTIYNAEIASKCNA